jgi:threonine synthase
MNRVLEGATVLTQRMDLKCKECGRIRDLGPIHVCDVCFGPLEVTYDYDAISRMVSRESITAGPPSIWRYESLLPTVGTARVDIGAGMTRLRLAPRLAAELGLRKLWIKEDGANPTHSFKDRVVSVAASASVGFGYQTIACASTGNLANSVAGHAAAAGLRSAVFIPAGLESGKVAATAVYGGGLFELDGSYDQVNRVCSELADALDWAFVNVNLRPFYSEGSKTIAFEIAENLGWRFPDAVVLPMASGSLLTKTAKGFSELVKVGLVDDVHIPKVYGAQASGCDPIVRAFESGADEITPVKPETIARSLAIGDPADGYYALKDVRASGGSMASVPEAEVEEGIRLLARTEGIFTETAGGVTVAGLERLVRQGSITPSQETVAVITGVGLKTIEAVSRRNESRVLPANTGAVLKEIGRRD